MADAPPMRRLKRANTSHLHGNKNWGSAFLLMDYLQRSPLDDGAEVLELGCGWGLAGLYCRKHFSAQVIASDADPAVFPFLHAQAEVNQLQVQCENWAFKAVPNWALAGRTLIGSDICFWDEMAEELYQLLERAIDAGADRILIADPGRPPFLAVAEACINEFYGELLPVRAHTQRKHRGYILRIENQ